MQQVDVAAGVQAIPEKRRPLLENLTRQREFGIFLFLILVSGAIAFLRPESFITPYNVLNMGRQMAELVVMASAMTLLIIGQELDLSVGSVYGLTSFTMGLLAQNFGVDLWVGLVLVMILAAFIGFVNGAITVYGRIPSFITTLGMLGVLRGITLFLSPWPVNRIDHPSFFGLLGGRVTILGQSVPLQIFWMLGIAIIASLILTRTTYGYHLRATGSNRTAAELSGIPVKRVKIQAFMFTSMMAALAGALGFAHVNSVSPTAGTGIELTTIAAVVIGGTALFGGEGTVIGTLLGAALLTVIRNGLIQIGGDGRLLDTYMGIIIVAAVLIHTHVGRRGR
jgi:ribose/xylose/arabinose/galactoside ABC-type transport system permease subunit